MPSIGNGLNQYRIIGPLGKGGMGEVFLAEDTILHRKAAIKFLPESAQNDYVARKRLLNEAQAAAALDHPFICKIYETGESQGKAFIAMEYVSGETLADRLKREPVPAREASRFATEILEALQEAHERGIVHRDLKPANIMLMPQGHIKVMDFGIAKQIFPRPDGTEEDSPTITGPLTRTGTAVGTLAYMAPEQLRGHGADPRSDIFSFGILLYEMLSGRHPFRQPTDLDTVSSILRDQPDLSAESLEIPNELRRVLEKALAKDPEQRYQSIQDLRDELANLTEQRVEKSRRIPVAWGAVVVLVLAFAAAGLWRLLQQDAATVPAAAREPVSVLIADFENKTGDPVFDGALEQSLGIALEGAPFITAHNRGQARKLAGEFREGVKTLDETLARLVAAREGVNVIIGGSIVRDGQGYRVSTRVIDALAGKPILSESAGAGSKDDVLAAIGKLAAQARRALGDRTPESVQLAASETFTAGSVEAAHNYALAQEILASGKWEEAIRRYSLAVQLDPNLGRAYAGLAVAHNNLGQRQEAEKYYEMAMARIDRMSEREKYRTRGGYYLMIGNHEKAAEEFQALVKQYPADTAGQANLALAYFYRRDMDRALQEGRRAVELAPKIVPHRNNLALYAMYAGDFPTALTEARRVLELNSSFEKAYLVLALSQLVQEGPQEAVETYQRLKLVSTLGASLAAMGLADITLYEGRSADAIALLEQGIQGDWANSQPFFGARKLLMLASIHAGRRPSLALQAAETALGKSKHPSVVFLAAGTYLQAGQLPKATALASQLEANLRAESQAYSRLIRGELHLAAGRAREALQLFGEAQKLADSWLVRFALGRAYLEANAFAEAHSEFESCVKRRGEATAVFLDDLPTYHVLPPVYYYLGRAQQGLKSPAAAESYRTFLAVRKGAADDPLVMDARHRLASN